MTDRYGTLEDRLHGIRIKRDQSSLAGIFGGQFFGLADQCLMAQMKSVKIADAGGNRRRYFLQVLHVNRHDSHDYQRPL